MGWKVSGKTSPFYEADVDSSGNLFVTLPKTINSTNSAGIGYAFMAFAGANKAASTFGPMGRMATGVQTMELFDPVDGTSVNTNIWNQQSSGMTIAQSGTTGYMVLNSAAATTINSHCQINSIKRIQLINTFVPTVRILFKTPNVPQANATMELGFGVATGAAAATEAAFVTWNSAGEFRGMTIFNSGTAQQTGILANPSVNVNHTFHATFRGTKVEFFIDDLPIGEVANAAGNPSPMSLSRLPVFARVFTGAIVPVVAPELHIGAVSLWRNDLNTNKLWPTQMVTIGRGSYQSPVAAFGQTANHANSTSPTSAVLSNTAAGYTTLGGKWQFAAPAGAATDFPLFGFQVPTDFQLIITGVRIDAVNTGAAVATTATILDWALGINASAVSLATVDGAGTWAPRRMPIGAQSWTVGAAIGAPVDNMRPALETPVVVEGGRFFHIIVQVPVGTATAAQVIRGAAQINGYFE